MEPQKVVMEMTLIPADDEESKPHRDELTSIFGDTSYRMGKAQLDPSTAYQNFRAMLTDKAAAWLNSHPGRKMHLKIKDIEGELNSVEELQEFLRRAEPYLNVDSDERASQLWH